MEKVIIPKRYSEGYHLDEEFLDDLEEETELLLDMCHKEDNVNYRKLLKLLERYYRGEYLDLKLKINQPGIFFLLHTYIQLEMFDKAKELYFRIYDSVDVNHRAIVVNIAIHYDTSSEADAIKLMKFIDYLVENEREEMKTHYFYLIIFLSSGALQVFGEGLLNMACEFGVNEETIPIYLEIKDMCKKARILRKVRALIKEVGKREGSEVFRELYKIM